MKITRPYNKVLLFLLVILTLILAVYGAVPQPSAPNSLINLSSISPSLGVGSMLNTSGGTISTVNINGTTQNFRWKGFVGNIEGALALQDSSLNALASWDIQTTTGEIYATRNSTLPNWDNIDCANSTTISEEETALNITAANVDSISSTFSTSTHDAFYVGLSEITGDSCKAIALNVNNTEQTADFQEVLLSDGSNLIYSSLIEDSAYGFDNSTYDFQMIVAESALEGDQPNTAYYFYLELI